MASTQKTDGSSTRSRYDVGVLHKALDVIEQIVELGPLTALELSRGANISSTAAYRVLGTLVGRGYVVQEEAGRRYGPGPALLALSRSILSSVDLVSIARPTMEALRDEFGETVNLGALTHDGRLVYLEMIASERGLRTAVDVGSTDHLHSTALGRAILAELSSDEARATLKKNVLIPVTRRTPVSLKAVTAAISRAREAGYAVDDEENELGARCVGAAIRDANGRPFAAVSISGPVSRIDTELLPVFGERLRGAATEIEHALGHAIPTPEGIG
jgi:DNA-binding IclR family transcriptional regulator